MLLRAYGVTSDLSVAWWSLRAGVALERCLAEGAAKNACGELDAALAACSADAGPGSTPGAPCSAGGVCEAQCYLDSVPDLCAPQPAGLGAFAQCASRCTF